MASPYFWETPEQARERLEGTYIMYDGYPVYVNSISVRDGRVQGLLTPACPEKNGIRDEGTWIDLDNPGFKSFHELPPLGFVNLYASPLPMAIHLQRLAERGRQHGLRANRIFVGRLGSATLEPTGGAWNFTNVMADTGYLLRLRKEYPTASEIVQKLPNGSSAAFSPVFAITRDHFGLTRLWRRGNPLGMISEQGVSLVKAAAGHYEELQESDTFDLERIMVA